uniref:Cell cycle checkpoint control protein n=1 Tax=Phallusia mammillata TaxID=59560 RepID=A0A6F9DQU4_9ASCI|nr:cell cycle checkpoint control protein RAD9A [Phallusia mammillata]
MKCVLPAVNVKLFAKAVHCLAKIGSEIYFEPLENGLALKTVNSSRSAYVCFLFHQPMFQTYEYEPTSSENGTLSEDVESDGFRCKIAVKTMLQVFKSLSTIERSVESCDINFDGENCKLVFQLKCRHGITKTHHLTYQECESLQAVFAKDLSPNILKCEHKLLTDVAANFSTGLEEISMCVTPCQVNLKSFVNEDDENAKIMRTEMTLNPEEFSDFQIGVDTEVTFCLKDLRAILAFCDVAGTTLEMHFEIGGKPLIISTEQEHYFRANFVMATVANDEDSISQQAEKSNNVNFSSNTRNRSRTTASRKHGSHAAPPRKISPKKKSSTLNNGHRSAMKMPVSKEVDLTTCEHEISPEIPDQNQMPVDDPEHSPPFKRIRSVFFEPSQNLPDHSIVVLAPDSDDDMGN